MGRLKRLCVAGSVCLLVFVLLQSTASAQAFQTVQAGSPSVRHGVNPAALTCVHVDRVMKAFTPPFLAFSTNLHSRAVELVQQFPSHVASLQWSVAQSDIPEVLTPSLEPPPEPSIYIPTETPSVTPTAVSTTNVTTPLTQQNSISLERLFSGIPLLTVVLLAPLLVVIAVLFYTLLRTEQEGERPPGEEDSETESARVVRRSLRARYRKKRHTKR
ncbi:MAG: hypothetical protein ACXV6K_10795 [Halobacteriota archaeon]